MYSVLVNLMRAACRRASERAVKSEGRLRATLLPSGGRSVNNWLPLAGWITSFVALRSISRAPTAMAAFSWNVSQSGASRVSVMVSSWMPASASWRSCIHSGMRSTSLRATGISHSGSSLSDTRMVSPMPSVSRAPMPTADLMRPSSPSPASVTPKCSG